MALVTLQEAKIHLRVTDDAQNEDVYLKLTAAEATILNYINTTATWRTASALWTAATVPAFVHAAILLQLGELHRFRGDDLQGQGPPRDAGQDFQPVITNLLRRTRDPVVA